MLIVGLTGSSGSGKTYLSSLICDKDILCIDTDSLYHAMISGPSACVSELSDAFGEGILNDRGGVNRTVLAGIVFSDSAKLEALNAITHKYILSECRRIIDKSNGKIVIIDAPVLFESGFDKECDITVGIIASDEIRVERIVQRDGITEAKAYQRIKSQKSNDWFRSNCDLVFVNEADINITAQMLKNELLRLYAEKEKKKEEE